MKRYREALADSNREIELEPKSGFRYSSRGYVYFLMEQYEQALADYNRAIELDPNIPAFFSVRGTIHRMMGQYGQALADYTRVLQMDPNDAVAIAGRGDVHLFTGEYEKALADFTRALELDSKDAQSLISRAATYRRMGQYDKALEDYNRAILLDPKNASAYAGRGRTRLRINDLNVFYEAFVDFKEAHALDKSDWYAYLMGLGEAYQVYTSLAAGTFKKAIDQALTAYQKNPKNWNNTFDFGLYHLAAGNLFQSEQIYRRALTEKGIPAWHIREAIYDLDEYLFLFPQSPFAEQMRQLLQEYLG